MLVVSQFTLSGDARNGRRPSFVTAAPPELARALYEDVVRELRAAGLRVETGEFQAMMQVALDNDGPVTILLDSRKNVLRMREHARHHRSATCSDRREEDATA